MIWKLLISKEMAIGFYLPRRKRAADKALGAIDRFVWVQQHLLLGAMPHVDFLFRLDEYNRGNGLVSFGRCQNPRLTERWLTYFAACGARAVEGGVTWKTDPAVGRGFGPWKAEWIAPTSTHQGICTSTTTRAGGPPTPT